MISGVSVAEIHQDKDISTVWKGQSSGDVVERGFFLPCRFIVVDGPWLNSLPPFGFCCMCEFVFYFILVYHRFLSLLCIKYVTL